MMQSSDLDKKTLSSSSTSPQKQSWASSSPYVPMDTDEDAANGKTCTSEIDKNDVDTQCEKKIDDPTTAAKKINISNITDKTSADLAKRTTSPDLETSGGGLNGGTGGNVEQKGFFAVLKNPNFLALWGGQVFCQLADKVYLVLMIALINTQFQTNEQSISRWVSALMMAFTIPAVLFGSIAGVFVDRWSKKAVLVATNLWRGILVLVIPLLLWVTHDWQPVGNLPIGFLIILGVTFLVSTLTQFFAPAEQAAIPLVVKEQDLLSANSLYTTTMMASVIIGFAVGEPLLAVASGVWQQLGGSGGLGKEILVGGSYAIAGIILLLLVTQEKPEDTKKETPHIFTDLREGFSYVKDNYRLRNALIQLIILFSVFAALTVLAVRMAEVIENLKASQFGFLLAAGGVGIAIGATLLGQFCQRFSYTQLSLCGCVGMATSLLGLSIFTKELWVVVVLILMLGVFGALIGIPMQTAIQTETPASMRGKVFGLQNNVINIALSLPLGLAGVAESFVGLQTVFLALAAIVFSGGLFTWYNSER
jgi:predicted MFS family arabinose efflux permease